MRHDPAIIDRADLESSLRVVRAAAAGSREGVFGPDSVAWQVDREAVVFLGAGRALLMQLAHPWVATAIAEHSPVLKDPIGRFHRTFDIVFTLVFGSLDQALQTSRRLHRRHAAISGTLPEGLGSFPAGSGYVANQVAALMWVHATLVDTALVSYEQVLRPLEADARDRYYTECRILGALFGIPLAAQPPDWRAFSRYVGETLRSDRLAVGPAAKEIAENLLKGAGWIPVPSWYRDVTAAIMPEGLRTAFQLPFGVQEQRRAARALRILRRVYPILPSRLRHVGPYQEALARVSGETGPDMLTRLLNRLWIGRSAISR
jgi:uncharacterized protein (DUF2236 family)